MAPRVLLGSSQKVKGKENTVVLFINHFCQYGSISHEVYTDRSLLLNMREGKAQILKSTKITLGHCDKIHECKSYTVFILTQAIT